MPDIFIAFIPVLLFLAFLFPAVAVILLLKLLNKPKEQKSYKHKTKPKVIECTSIVKLVNNDQTKPRNITIL